MSNWYLYKVWCNYVSSLQAQGYSYFSPWVSMELQWVLSSFFGRSSSWMGCVTVKSAQHAWTGSVCVLAVEIPETKHLFSCIYFSCSFLTQRDRFMIENFVCTINSSRHPAGLESQLQILYKVPHTHTKGCFFLMTNNQRLTSHIQVQKVWWSDCCCMCNLILSTLVSYRNVWSIWLLLISPPELL